MNLAEISIRRPVMTTLIMLSLLVLGIGGYRLLPVAALPRVDFPTIQVNASLAGASPESMASSVAGPLERQFSTISGISSMTSQSTQGSTSITLQFDLERDIDAAALDVQSALSIAQRRLPSEMTTAPSFRKVNPADSPVVFMALSSASLPLTQVDDYAQNIIAPQISQLPGVAQVQVYGSQKRAIRIDVDPRAAAGRGVTLSDLRNAIASASTAYILEIPKYVLEATLYLTVMMLAVVQFLTKDLGAAAATVALFLAAGSRVVPAMLRLQGAGITIRNASVQAQPTFVMADFLSSTRPKDAIDERAAPIRETALKIRERIAAGHGDFTASISVRGATLTYLEARRPALLDASFSAAPGTSVALVGPTGAGKSTLADVILGVLEPEMGEVLISGVSPKDAVRLWPGAIAYIPQNVALIQGAVRENVALGLPRDAIDDDLVWEALHRAHLADFLRDSREGLDTSIGERGIRLSGGQRQRLGIARALYTRPLLLLLDEATSSLDAETEQDIIDTLKELEGKVTTVTVAHRLATVRLADQVLYLSDGAIIARGTFEEVRSQVTDFDRQASLLGL